MAPSFEYTTIIAIGLSGAHTLIHWTRNDEVTVIDIPVTSSYSASAVIAAIPVYDPPMPWEDAPSIDWLSLSRCHRHKAHAPAHARKAWVTRRGSSYRDRQVNKRKRWIKKFANASA